MSGLVLKDFLVLRKHLRTYLLFLAFYLALGFVGVFPLSVVTSIISVVIMMIPLSTFSYDAYAKWDRYAATLPLGRRTMVSARYLFVLLLWVVTACLALLSCVFLSISGQSSLEEALASALTVLAVSLGIVDIMLPLTYKLGPERSRTYLYIIVFLPSLLLFALYRLGVFDQEIFRWLVHLPERSFVALTALLPLLGLAGLGVSWLFSCRIMENKEF